MVGLITFMMILSSATFALGFYLGARNKEPKIPTLLDSITPLIDEPMRPMIIKKRTTADENALKKDFERMKEERRRPS